ncbi:MAG: TM2 domain-containing protein [Dysgonamonadaceae bacterium]|nr:TM2 domain-containing protein [Dysgonamonadaceae bacterium]
MDASKVDLFIMTNGKYFDSYQLHAIKQQLVDLPEEKWSRIQLLQLKDPTTTLIISLLGGSLGIDRFFIGDVGLGIVKLLTCGGLGIWTIVDWFLIMATTKDKNIQKLQESLLV